MRKMYILITILVLIAFTIIVTKQINTTYATGTHTEQIQKAAVSEKVEWEGVGQAAENEKAEALSHETIVRLTDQFMELLVQETDDNYRVKHYDTKEALLDAFDPYVKRESAEPYIDYYYEEKADGLYIIPTETPPWFQKDQEYEKIVKDKKTVEIKQTNQTDLYGPYTIIIEFQNIDGSWIIANIRN
ncbi:hypothetical protein [Gracilibacillus sp. YIM 98692]|uniref:hypothetical protein n=1 Tax=Gracilibacillus sp. YIM 98692 TaxID=2663532 RepID=UPI0013D4218D|nr:hypothetical protein [Gracilibacillus sp. YIM 98692]